MRFWDQVTVHVRGGKGGSGHRSWHREAHIPRGGPDGGSGGDGGAVIFVADNSANTLEQFSFERHLFAADGEEGGTNNCTGKNGVDLIRKVPVGTQVFYKDQLVADLSQLGARWVAARGGHGGKGNLFFLSAERQAPDFSQEGQAGDECELRLVLKSVADIALVGFPNVGKSSLLAVLTAAKPKIANYPFTTLVPNLGVAIPSSRTQFVIADIPGLIPNAHDGRGLGIEFLRHIERCKALVFVLDGALPADETDGAPTTIEIHKERALSQFATLLDELRQYSPALLDRPSLVVFSKCDIEENAELESLCAGELKEIGYNCVSASSQTGLGIAQLLERLRDLLPEQTTSTEHVSTN